MPHRHHSSILATTTTAMSSLEVRSDAFARREALLLVVVGAPSALAHETLVLAQARRVLASLLASRRLLAARVTKRGHGNPPHRSLSRNHTVALCDATTPSRAVTDARARAFRLHTGRSLPRAARGMRARASGRAARADRALPRCRRARDALPGGRVLK